MFSRLILTLVGLMSLAVPAHAASVLDEPIEKKYSPVLNEMKKAKSPEARKQLLDQFVAGVNRDVAAIPSLVPDEATDRAGQFFELQIYVKEISLDALTPKTCQFNRHHILALSNPQAIAPTDATPIGRFVLEIVEEACRRE